MRTPTKPLLGVALLVASTVAVAGPGDAGSPARLPTFSVPRAHCGPSSHPEPGLQGEVPPADEAGHLVHAYRCNLGLVGQWPGEATGIQMAWYGHCAYLTTDYEPTDPEYDRLKGVVVLDVSDPARPRETARLQSEAMVHAGEALKAHQGRGLLATTYSNASPDENPAPVPFEVWDVSEDCAHPRLRGSVTLPSHHGHEGDFSADGRTYYAATALNIPDPGLIPIDISDPTHPVALTAWANPLTSREGFHGYAPLDRAGPGRFGSLPVMGGPDNGIAIVDVTDVELRRPDPSIEVVSTVPWNDSDTPHAGIGARIGGRNYLIVPSEGGSVFADPPDVPKACEAGTPPYGFPRIVDVTDVRHPRVVSRIPLEVNDPANCPITLQTPSIVSLTYSSHYCSVDDPQRTTMLACTWLGSGLRVFDVRNPWRPREIAYYNPPGRPDAVRTSPFKSIVAPAPYMDVAGSNVRWQRAADGRWRLWFTSMQNGLQVLELTTGAGRAGAGR